MRVGTQVRLVKDDEGLYMMEVYMDGHYRTRYIDCIYAKRTHEELLKFIDEEISEVEDRIDMDIALEEEDSEEKE